jgi:Ca2+-dependent lipid-binding protein
MPGKVKVRVLAGRNLPVMDRSSDTTDAYVEVKLGSTTYKTDVCRKSLNPQWNSDWYKFEVSFYLLKILNAFLIHNKLLFIYLFIKLVG